MENLGGRDYRRYRPQIALLVDHESWALGNIARQVQKHLSSYYDFQIIAANHLNHISQAVLLAKHCDLVHFFWRMHYVDLISSNCRNYLHSIGGDFDLFYKRYIRPMNFSIGVYDHLYIKDEAFSQVKEALSRAAGYYVSSSKLQNVYGAIAGIPAPQGVVTDGVDLQLFRPEALDRFRRKDFKQEIVVGWTGNSDWNWTGEDVKGVETVLKPTVERLRQAGYPFVLKMADRREGFVPQRLMYRFYAQIDLYVCVSLHEGTPNPVLEAMACGVPVISTDVGIAAQAFGEKQRAFIMKERSSDMLERLLIKLVERPALFAALSEENRRRVSAWSWGEKARPFAGFFDHCLRNNMIFGRRPYGSK